MNLTGNPSKASEILVEDVHYVNHVDGYGVKHKHLNFEHYRKKEGVVELIPLREAKGVAGSPKHENKKIFARYRDRKTKLVCGILKGLNYETKQLEYQTITVEGRMMLDCSIEDDSILHYLITNGLFCEGSPNLVGKPTYKVLDKAIIADNNIDKRTFRRKAEDIIVSLKRDNIREMAVNLGINLAANNNDSMLLDELYRVMELNPKKFIDIYNNPNRVYISVFNKAKSDGVILLNHESGQYKYNGLDLGHTEEMAVKFLVDNKNIANTINLICQKNDADSNNSMGNEPTYEEKSTDSKEDTIEDLKRKLAEALAKQEAKEPETPKVDEVLVELRKEAQELGVKGFALMGKEKLIDKIAEAKEVSETKE